MPAKAKVRELYYVDEPHMLCAGQGHVVAPLAGPIYTGCCSALQCSAVPLFLPSVQVVALSLERSAIFRTKRLSSTCSFDFMAGYGPDHRFLQIKMQ